ncbi:hypothetical protein FHS23_003746 [Prauserella isguenensis]|uniref:Uncharacterized protein n=1 Tax=Prauserella isguenensis TaxID=1470180 RepID=A0A839S5R1_9PSEU|nr:hypothetical protein [Prauserella isguenensis]MBB3052712.1 hypothetical protein [Prauserella isguenensis]
MDETTETGEPPMGISGRADLPWTASAVDGVRRRAAEYGPHDGSVEWSRRRQESLDVEAWEVRRCGRTARLWTAELLVRTAAPNAVDAAFRLVTLAHPYHRTGHVPRLYSVAGPILWRGAAAGVSAEEDVDGGGPEPSPAPPSGPSPGTSAGTSAGTQHPALVGGSPHRGGATREEAERARAADHAVALELAGRGVRRAPPRHAPGWPCWQVWQRVSFLAGPGDAPARAAELAATVVDTRGAPAAAVTRLAPQDGRRDPVDGHLVHPACDLGPHRIDALWDDFDAVETGLGDPGEPVALAAVCLAAAREVRAEFGLGDGDPVPAAHRARCAATSGAGGAEPRADR